MGRSLPERTRIRIRCSDDPRYQRGDVIAFSTASGLVGHRIVGHGRPWPGFVLARGDGVWLSDRPVPVRDILGQIIAWLDGDVWRPVPEAPRVALLRRALMAAHLGLLRAAFVAHPRAAAALAALSHRVSAIFWP